MQHNNVTTVKKKPIRTKSSRGMVMGATMFVLVMMVTVALVGVITQTNPATTNGGLGRYTSDSQIFGKRRAELYVAQTLAEDGARMAMQWLNQSRQAPQNDSAFAPTETTQTSCAGFMGSGTITGNHWSEVTVSNASGYSGKAMIRLYPFKENNTSGRKQFIIESVGVVNGVKQIVRATAVQQTFAKYAFFADKILLNPANKYEISFTSQANGFKGPVHINGMLPDGSAVNSAAKINIRWQSPSVGASAATREGMQIFRYAGAKSFTTAMDSSQITWMNMSGAPLTPTVSTWADVIATGKEPQTAASPYNIKPIRLPLSTTTQKDAATNGVTPVYAGVANMRVQAMTNSSNMKDGGFYVNGDVSNVLLKATGTNNTTQVIEIMQVMEYGAGGAVIIRPVGYVPPAGQSVQEHKAVITIDRMANTTTVTSDTRQNNAGVVTAWSSNGSSAYSGASNGVIYFEGNIGDTTSKVGGLSGAIANSVMLGTAIDKDNSLMIVTDQTKTVQINGGIIFANTQNVAKGGGTVSAPTGNLVSSAKDPVFVAGTGTTTKVAISGLLGIVTKNVLITQTDVGGGNFVPVGGTGADLSIHAIVMAYDTIEADGWNVRLPGTCTLIGGFISAGAKPMGGTSVSVTGSTVTVNTTSGFNVDRNYDDRGASAPPPFYPAPPGASFVMTSMQRAITPLDGAMP
jgi:hypothetical protein